MRIKKCKVCGFPYWLAKSLVWNGNGTITSKNRPDFRTLIIEADYLSEIFAKIEEALGVSIQHIVFEAQRNAAKDVIDGNIDRVRWAIRYIPGVRRLVITYFNRMASWTGQGYAHTISYGKKGAGAAIIRNPFNQDLMSAVVVGALESLGEAPYDYRWEKRGDDDVIVVEPTGEHPEISERLTYTTPPLASRRPPLRGLPGLRRARAPQGTGMAGERGSDDRHEAWGAHGRIGNLYHGSRACASWPGNWEKTSTP